MAARLSRYTHRERKLGECQISAKFLALGGGGRGGTSFEHQHTDSKFWFGEVVVFPPSRKYQCVGEWRWYE